MYNNVLQCTQLTKCGVIRIALCFRTETLPHSCLHMPSLLFFVFVSPISFIGDRRQGSGDGRHPRFFFYPTASVLLYLIEVNTHVDHSNRRGAEIVRRLAPAPAPAHPMGMIRSRCLCNQDLVNTSCRAAKACTASPIRPPA